MRCARGLVTTSALALALGVAACGDDAGRAAPPTPDELAADLVTVDSFEGSWTVHESPDGAVPASGVVPEGAQGLLPSIALCDDASQASRDALEALRWQAYRQIDLAVADPIAPPDDRSGHLVFVQELLTAGEPDEIQATFELLRDGMQACLGDLPAGEEGPGRADPMALPAVGDDRAGVLVTVEEAGGWAEWRLHDALVRQGSVLMLVDVVDICAGVDPLFSVDEVGSMVMTAVERL